MIRAGRLRHRIEFLRPAADLDEFGQRGESLVVIATARASKEALRGREFLAADAINSEVDTRFRVRKMSGILPSDKIRHGDELYDIKGLIPSSGREQMIEIMAARVDQ